MNLSVLFKRAKSVLHLWVISNKGVVNLHKNHSSVKNAFHPQFGYCCIIDRYDFVVAPMHITYAYRPVSIKGGNYHFKI